MSFWKITKDYLDDKDSDLNRVGYARYPNNQNVIAFKKRSDVKKYAWRVLDDDQNVYYAGMAWFTDKTFGSNHMFNPLDEFCRADSGATEIQYFLNGQWETI